ncbi:MutT/nudix family protein [Lutibaculum baratangense AMV1]|uniref:MutT/nudix family protein n=1 Tax=Lutibaculum baratangense AMV1 TaxID=631454 RepID=V4RK10_9HYPH|nr:MutT/nudix family protein [Lutibaculum baratangense AMV1]
MFFPSALAFPGGAVDPTDFAVPAAGHLDPAVERLLTLRTRQPMSPRRPHAIACAAIRELFEETGIIVGGAAPASATPPRGWEAFFGHGFAPDLSGLSLFMRAITPPRQTRRFDNRFFAVGADRIAHALPPEDCPTAELEERRYLPIDGALGMEMPGVTRVALTVLRERLGAPGGLRSHRPVLFRRTVRGKHVAEEIS